MLAQGQQAKLVHVVVVAVVAVVVVVVGVAQGEGVRPVAQVEQQ